MPIENVWESNWYNLAGLPVYSNMGAAESYEEKAERIAQEEASKQEAEDVVNKENSDD
jgi:hypothetical protein